MILEVAILDIKSEMELEFEQAFQRAQAIISSMKGYVSHQLHHCIERSSRYILLVNWVSLEDHTDGFRNSAEYQRWKKWNIIDMSPETNDIKQRECRWQGLL